jgi:hypothetical protein
LELVQQTTGISAGSADLSLVATPNPFSQSTRISLHLPSDANVSLAVYGVLGNVIMAGAEAPLKRGPYHYEVGEQLPAGIYFVRLMIDGNPQVIKLLKAE